MNRHIYRLVFHSYWKFRCRLIHSDTTQTSNKMYILCKNLDINENVAEYLCIKYPIAKKINEDNLKSLINTVNDLGFSKEVLIDHPMLFGILPVTIRFRHKVLMECGVYNITPSIILSYLTIVKQKSIGELKKSELIPYILNVENTLAGHLTQWPTSLTSTIWGDVNESTLYKLRLHIIQKYLELVLDLTEEEFTRGITTYPTLKHRPLAVINETLSILQTQIMMPINKIKSNFYLIHADPENLKNIVYRFKTIGGIDIKEVIRLYPKIAMKNYKMLVEIRNVLKEHNIRAEAQRRCFDIYTLSSSTIRERLEKAKQIPEFNTFINHPRFLKMIHYNTTAIKRLHKLYSNNKKCLSLNILSGSSAHYEVYEKAPGDRLGKGKDLIFCITQSLGNTYKSSDVRNLLKKHPFWINIPLVQVKYVYERLSYEFSHKDIYENCPILLYPWSKIKEILDIFLINKTKQSLYFHENLNVNQLNKSQKLSLILYALEKQHYFSGNGVWSDEKNKINNNVS